MKRAFVLGRHQLAAGVGTAADFAAMIGLVEIAGASPPLATVVSAIVGAVVNFFVSRGWAFRRLHRGSFRSQAARYALVASGGALLNAVLLAAALRILPLGYPLARGLVSVAVGLLYSYPVHTRLVFRITERAS